MNKQAQKFGGFQQQQRQEPQHKEGEVFIKKNKSNTNSPSQNLDEGEYVDYEEVD